VNLTQIFIIIIIVIVLAYDVITQKIQQPTESTVLRLWARDWTLLPFCAGFLIGHWFAPRQIVSHTAWGNGLMIMAVLFGIDLYWKLSKKGDAWFRYPLWYALLGIPSGLFLWGQSSSWAPF